MQDKSKRQRILISACLLGVHCRSDGKTKQDRRVTKLLDEAICFLLCPEILAGFSIPRDRIEIKGGDGEDVLDSKAKVFTERGLDVTENILKAAKVILDFCKQAKVKKAIFKERSPSCGKNFIYDGSFSGKIIKGKGVVTALFQREGIEVISEEEFAKQKR